ncbi:MAG: sensor protein lytS [Chitinophagaceae bacterium]|nr:sensor protein lytS [Chitinophagaceae bacterium]
MFSHKYRYIFILILSAYTFLNTLLCEVYFYFGIDVEWYYALATICFVTFLTWEGSRLVQPLAERMISPAKQKIKFLIVFFLTGGFIACLAALVSVLLVGSVIHDNTWAENINPLKLNIIYAILINLFFHLLHAIFFFFSAYQKQWTEAESLRRSSIQAQLLLIRSQINPHFLFNNLNVLSGMVIKENPAANQFIEEFAKVYRYVLACQDKELVELEAELGFVEPYLFLLHKRFNEGLHVHIDIPQAARSMYIIPVALQMLIENAIKHNIVSRSKPLRIDIHVSDGQVLVVRNNIQPRQEVEHSSQLGLKNIFQRYELITDRNVIVRKGSEEFEVLLPLLNLN